MASPTRGRPRIQESADDIVASVFSTAGPRVSTAAYSTREIAERTGLSQTVVSRSARRIRRAGQAGRAARASTDPPATNSDSDGVRLRLAEIDVTYPVITVRAEVVGAMAARPTPRIFERRATAVMAALWVSGAAEWPAPEGAADADGFSAGPAPSLQARWRPGQGTWQDFLTQVVNLLDRCYPSADALPAELLRQLGSRAGRGLHGAAWSRDVPPAAAEENDPPSPMVALAEYPAPGRGASTNGPRVSLSATEQIAIALRKEMTSSGFRAGDQLSVGLMEQRLGLGTVPTRNAMRQLADDGLLTPSKAGFRIPHLTGTDVIDLYASRLQIGTVILRACADQPKRSLLRARLALGVLEALADEGSRADVGEADLRFQQELADASGLRQSARSFHALTLRLRFFISVLQLDYSPAVARLVFDDRRLLVAVMEGRADEAVRVWRSKLDDAVRHMSTLAPKTFDAQLWSRLTTP